MESQESNSRLVWFLLVDDDGKPFKGTSAQTVAIDDDKCVVGNFRQAVMKRFQDERTLLLDGISSSQLRIYGNRTAFDISDEEIQKPFDDDDIIHEFGKTEQDALIVLVPNIATLDAIQIKRLVSTIIQDHTIKQQRIEEERQFSGRISKDSNLDMVSQLINSFINETASENIMVPLDDFSYK